MLSKVTTTSLHCSELIDEGVLHLFNFDHEHAIVTFQKALTFDKLCPMAHFFIAYCNAGNYNNTDGIDYAEGWNESQIALNMTKDVSLSGWETALIEAQVQRFCSPPGSIPMDTLNRNYANAMRLVYQKFGDGDVGVATFFAESLMNLYPWKLWTPPPDIKPAFPETEELILVFEKAFKLSPTHLGLCHFYIHMMEPSDKPMAALQAADVLRNTVKDYGHLIHMPSHIDMWVGQYNKAMEANILAVESDEKYILTKDKKDDLYKVYRMHNYHFVAWAAMFNGQFSVALKYAEASRLQLQPHDITLKVGDSTIGERFFEPFASFHWHVFVRFGRWEDIINLPIEDKEVYPTSEAFARYARAVAFAALGRLVEADVERTLFYNALKDKSLSKRYLMINFMYDPEQPGKGILDVAEAVMNGEIEYHKGNFKEAFEHLRLAVKRDSGLLYDEPWSWMMPTRHVLGALLLEQGEAVEAEVVYREDLSQYKDNMWSLLGLHQALKQQQKVEEAELVLSKFQQASASADVKVGASCLCATKLCC